MNDPRRLLSQTGTLEARLLETVHDADPPPSAKDEIWHRIGMAAGAGAVMATTPLAVHAAASTATNAVVHAGWLSALKWVVVAGILLPAAGMTARSIVLARSRAAAPKVASVTLPVEKGAVEDVETKDPALDVAPTGSVSSPGSEVVPSLSNRAVAPRSLALPLRSSVTSNLDVENDLLKRARAKLEGGDASGALGDATALAARFPHGALAQEREVVAIQALLALKQRSTAASRTAEFLRVFPSSPYADALRRGLGP